MAIFDQNTILQLREAAFLQEKTGTLTPETLALIYQEKLFKLFVPEDFGGNLTALPEALKIFEQAAYIDGSFGWAVTIGAGGGFFSAYLTPQVAEKQFSPVNAVVAGSGHPTGTATKIEGVYQVSGSWKYCSGANYATIFTANCLVKEPGKADAVRAFVFAPEQVIVLDDWNTFGLKATGSHTITVENAFIPENHTFDLSQPIMEPLPLIFQYPFLQFAQASFAAVNLGICRHFLEETKTYLEANEKNWQTSDPKRYPFLTKKYKAALTELEETTCSFFGITEQSWKALEQGETLTEGLLQQVSWQCRHSVRVAVRSAQSLFPYLGLAAAKETTVLNQTYRDLHTACQHTLLLDFDDL